MEIRQVVPRDAIPGVDDPEFGPDYFGDPDDEVIVVEADPPRAYPVRVLDFHEVVNDCAPGPMAVTWCPLCGSAVVYDRRVGGRTLSFGVSGKLADDDLVLYDRETDSEWKQSSGECIAGPLKGERLTALPAATMAYGRFREAHPDGVVLQPPGGESEAASDDGRPAAIRYDADPYREYVEGEGFGLRAHRGEGSREWDREDLDPKAVVLGIEAGCEAVGVPRPALPDPGVRRLEVGGRAVVVFRNGDDLHAFDDPGFGFEVREGAIHADGTTWNPATGEADDGRRLDRVPARRLFAFAWQDDHGPDAFYRPEG